MSIRDYLSRSLVRGAVALGWDAGESSRFRRDLGFGRMTPRDEESMVGQDRTRELIRLKGSDLRRNNATVAGMCERIESFFVGTGIRPQALTKDTGWNKAAEEYFKLYAQSCDVRGRFDFFDFQALAVGCRPTQGGIYFEKLDNGQLRPIECERIRNPSNAEKAKGYVDGVKYDSETGRIVEYWVHNRDKEGTFTGDHKERGIAAKNMIPVVRRAWRADQGREIPDLAPIIPILTDFHEMDSYVRNTAKTRSQIIAFIKKLNGQMPNLRARTAVSESGSINQRDTWKMDWGQAHALFPEEDMIFPTINMPDPNTIPFMKLELMLAASAMNLPYEFFAFDFSSLDFSRQKGVLLFVNRVREVWIKKWLIPAFCQRVWNWRIAKEMKPGGMLAPAPIDARGMSEWNKVQWQGDMELDLDRQAAIQADIHEWQMGLVPLSHAANRRGIDLEDSLREKARIMKLAGKIEMEEGLPTGSLINAQIPGQITAQNVTEPQDQIDDEESEDNSEND